MPPVSVVIGPALGSSLQRWQVLWNSGPSQAWDVPKGEVLMFCLAVLPLRPWSNYCVVKFVFSASSSISALFYSCFVFASLFCVHMHVFSHVVVSTFTLPIVQDGASPSPEAALPIQSPHAVRVFSSLSNPAHFPSIPFHSIHFRVLITTEMNHNRLFTSCLPY